jgi:predicted DNA-binding protein with PD1-like motif
MKSKLLNNSLNERAFTLVFDTGDDILQVLLRFANEQKISSAHFTAIGACQRATIGFFDLEKKEYEKIQIDEQVEVMSLIGNIAIYEREPKIHSHLVLGKRDGTAHGGHLLEAIVRPTLEMFLTESAQILTRRLDNITGLPLIDLDA